MFFCIADASESSRQLLVPRVSLLRAGRLLQEQSDVEAHVHQDGVDDDPVQEVQPDVEMGAPAGGVQDGAVDADNMHIVDAAVISDGEDAHAAAAEADAGPDLPPEELELEPICFQPVLADFTCDWPGRSKLAQWKDHTATFNGGWCMCNMRGTHVRLRLCCALAPILCPAGPLTPITAPMIYIVLSCVCIQPRGPVFRMEFAFMVTQNLWSSRILSILYKTQTFR